MDKKEFSKMLGVLKARMHINNALICIFVFLAAAGIIAVCLSYASLWLPVPFLERLVLTIFLGAAASGMLISFFLRPSLKNLIATADGLGLKERVITAWQLRENDSLIAGLQREDAKRTILNADFKVLYPLRFPTKIAIAFAVSILLVAVSFALPGYARDEAGRIEALKNAIKEQTEALEKAKESIEKNGALTEKEFEEITEQLEALKEELKKAKTEEDALKALSRTENELDKMDVRKQLNQLGKSLTNSEMTKDLGESLENENITDMKQALEKLQQQMEQEEISPEELAEILEQAAAQLENKEISEKLTQEARKIAAGDTAARSDALQDLSDVLSQMMEQQGNTGSGQALGQISQALQQAKARISQVDNRLGAGGKTAQGEEMGGDQPKDQENKNGKGQGAGTGQQQGGKGQGSGLSGSEGQSESGDGGGAGEGSTNKDAGNTGSEGPGAGREPGERKEEEYEQLYDPERLGGSKTPDQVSGSMQEGGQSRFTQADNIPVQKGEMLPYREVLARYKEEAAAYMEDTVIPAAMKQIVREYFKSLE